MPGEIKGFFCEVFRLLLPLMWAFSRGSFTVKQAPFLRPKGSQQSQATVRSTC